MVCFPMLMIMGKFSILMNTKAIIQIAHGLEKKYVHTIDLKTNWANFIGVDDTKGGFKSIN